MAINEGNYSETQNRPVGNKLNGTTQSNRMKQTNFAQLNKYTLQDPVQHSINFEVRGIYQGKGDNTPQSVCKLHTPLIT